MVRATIFLLVLGLTLALALASPEPKCGGACIEDEHCGSGRRAPGECVCERGNCRIWSCKGNCNTDGGCYDTDWCFCNPSNGGCILKKQYEKFFLPSFIQA